MAGGPTLYGGFSSFGTEDETTIDDGGEAAAATSGAAFCVSVFAHDTTSGTSVARSIQGEVRRNIFIKPAS